MKLALRIAAFLHFAVIVAAHPGSGIAVDSQGRVYFAAGPMVVMILTNDVARVIVTDPNHERFYQLHHLQRAPDGGLLTASDLGNAIWRLTPEGALSRFYPPENDVRAVAVGTGGDPFAVDGVGNVYAVNSAQGRFTQILKIAPDGRVLVLAGGDWGFADGKGLDARFGDLHSGAMVMAPDGSLVLTDDSARVRRVSADGTVATLAGGHEQGDADGLGPDARFRGASGLVFDQVGDLFVVEYVGRIRKLSRDGVVTTVAGRRGRGSRDGPLSEAGFDGPTGIAIGPNGNLYVLEPEGPRVRRIADGRVTTLLRGLP